MTAQPLKTAPVKPDPLWEKRLQLAVELDAQGIYPPAWTQAQRARWRDQEGYLRTGTYDTDRHFIAAGQLYDRAHPALTPSRAQAEESLKAYVGEPRKPLAETIPVHEVPLQHPVGQPYLPTSKADAEEKAKLLARQNVNHLTWHDGDALPGHLDQWIKTNGYKTSDVYQGPDGHHYRHNEITRTEAPDVVALRLKHSGEQTMQEIADGPDPAEPHVVRQIADDWLKEARSKQRGLNAHKAQTETPAPATPVPETPTLANDNKPTAASPSIPETVAQKIRETASALDKLKADAALSPSEFQTLSDLQRQIDQAGFKINLRDIDPKTLMPAAEKLTVKAATADRHIDGSLLTGTAITAEAAELAGAGAASAVPEVIATLLAPEIVLPAAALVGGAALLAKYGTPPDGTKGAGRVWATKRSIEPTGDVAKPIPAPEPLKPIEAGRPDLGGNPVPQIPLTPEQLPVPDYVKPLIDVIPTGYGSFIKPTILPGWDSRPEELDPNVYNRKGGETEQRRIDRCLDRAAEIFKSLGYTPEGRFGGSGAGEHYFPNPEGKKVEGGAWGDGGLNLTAPDGEKVSWHLSSYDVLADMITPTTRELLNAARLVNNWLALLKNSKSQSEHVRDHYNWFKGAFSMVAKKNKDAQYDDEALEECERQVRNAIDENGKLKTPIDVDDGHSD